MMTLKEVPKHVADCVSVVFTIQCTYGSYDLTEFCIMHGTQTAFEM